MGWITSSKWHPLKRIGTVYTRSLGNYHEISRALFKRKKERKSGSFSGMERMDIEDTLNNIKFNYILL